jgi:hypothetical protein
MPVDMDRLIILVKEDKRIEGLFLRREVGKRSRSQIVSAQKETRLET